MSTSENSRVKIIGVGEAGLSSLSAGLVEIIQTAHTLFGGERQLSLFPDFKRDKVVIKNKISALPRQIEELLQKESGHLVVLASGDPLFFGIGAFLSRKLGREAIEIFPALSSLQLAFSKAGLSWYDASLISLHGRSIRGAIQKINGCSKAALLTDHKNHPGEIAKYLQRFELTGYRVYVAEDLGGPGEKFSSYGPGAEGSLEDLAALSAENFHELNVVILERVSEASGPAWPFGISDEEFFSPESQKGLITKKEIRVQVLSALELLGPGGGPKVLWDIGACTGSVSIEAARLNPELSIFALEKESVRLECCQKNMIKFKTDFELIHEKAPKGLENLPQPSAVFIGGSSGNLNKILDHCCERLLPGGVVVAAAATLETLDTSSRKMRGLGYEVEVTQLWFSRSKPIGKLHRLEAQNPVFLIKGKKPGAMVQDENQTFASGDLKESSPECPQENP